MAQGTMRMHTGAGVVLQTVSVPYDFSGFSLDPVLSLEFGFATLETPQPGLFADSFTISIQSSAGIAYLLTADASGVQWAPAVPGTSQVLESSIERSETVFAVASEGLWLIGAYDIQYRLPPAWHQLPVTVKFDLFDNQDGFPSFGYLNLIPEPSPALLIVLGLTLWTRFRHRG